MILLAANKSKIDERRNWSRSFKLGTTWHAISCGPSETMRPTCPELVQSLKMIQLYQGQPNPRVYVGLKIFFGSFCQHSFVCIICRDNEQRMAQLE